MADLRCQCGKKIAEYDDYEVRIMDKKCKEVTTLQVINGKLYRIGTSEIKSDENGEPYQETCRTTMPSVYFKKV